MANKVIKPAPPGKGTYVETSGDQTIDGSLTIGSDSEAGFVDIKNTATLPAFGIAGPYGYFQWDTVLHNRIRETDTGAAYVKREHDQSIIGSYFGYYYKTGFDLSKASYTEVRNWLWSSDSTYSPITPWEYTEDDLTLRSQSSNAETPVVSLVADADRGTVFDYTLPYKLDTVSITYAIDEYWKTTGINASATGWVESGWVKFPATAVAVSGNVVFESMVGIFIGVDSSGGNGIAAKYDTNGDLDKIIAFSSDSAFTISVEYTLEASPVADTWYHFNMVCDGTTGIDYYVTDEDGINVTNSPASEANVAIYNGGDFSAWAASYYAMLSYSGYATGAPISFEGGIDDFRVDEFSFWTAN